MEKIILVVFFIVFILYFLYLVRVFVFSFKKYRKTMRLNKAIIFSFLNTFRHAIIIEYGATIDPKERYWMKLIKSLLVLIILLNSTIVNVSEFKNDLINRDFPFVPYPERAVNIFAVISEPFIFVSAPAFCLKVSIRKD